MIICQNCFLDTEIKSIILSLRNKCTCDICGETDFCISSDISKNEWNQIKEYLDQIKEIYTPEDKLPFSFPNDKKFILSDIFSFEWKIINSELSKKQKDHILLSFFSNTIDYNKKYGNSLIIDKDYLNNYAILRDSNWGDFVEALKHKNRFHSKFFNETVLTVFCRCFEKYIPENSKFLRGRISQTEIGLQNKELEAPPKNKATAGRANAEGISRLYLADSQDTVLKEVRAGVFDYVSIAQFISKRKLTVVDFTALDLYSPFSMEVNISILAVNKDALDNISMELGRPMRRTDNILDYVPTQYLVDFIESIRDKKTGKRIYDGVMYKSVMNFGGVNLVAFDSSAFKQHSKIETIKINSVTYHRTTCNKS